ncbi:hypothetical protein [uncultured Croceitalea sp.]|uniref:hypothetical protein n=1 Tax=uncultured Croceitalea sp. TaxID=1798908 RepID=UPI0033062DF4
MKNYLPFLKLFFLVLILFTLNGCSNDVFSEQLIINDDLSSLDNQNIELQSKLEKAKEIFYSPEKQKPNKFLNVSKSKNNTSRSYFSSFPVWDLSQTLSAEEENNEFLITPVFPSLNDLSGVHSRAIFYENSDSYEGVIFTKVQAKEQDNELFDGKFFLHTLNGEYISGYRIKDNEIVSKFLPKIGGHIQKVNGPGDDECDSPGCSLGEGEEVVVYGHSPTSFLFFTSVYLEDEAVDFDYDGAGATSIFPCENNFNFVDIADSGLWQESVLSGFSQKLVYDFSIVATIYYSGITFGLPHTVDGTTLFMHRDARRYAGYALSEALRAVKLYFRQTKGALTSITYSQYFLEKLKLAFSALTGGAGRVNSGHSINSISNLNAVSYQPCS